MDHGIRVLSGINKSGSVVVSILDATGAEIISFIDDEWDIFRKVADDAYEAAHRQRRKLVLGQDLEDPFYVDCPDKPEILG